MCLIAYETIDAPGWVSGRVSFPTETDAWDWINRHLDRADYRSIHFLR